MKESGLKISGMAILGCWLLLLLLATFPLLAFAGRHNPPAGPVFHDQPNANRDTKIGAAAAVEVDNNIQHYSRQLLQNEIRGPTSFSWVQVWKQYSNKKKQQKLAGAAAVVAAGTHDPAAAAAGSSSTQILVQTSTLLHSRLLIGSSPPTCRGSCGVCYPCKPVHVIIGIPRVAITEQEYYPEVWRCQCGNMLFIP